METLTIAEAKSKRAHIRAAATRLKNFLEGFRIGEGSRYEISERKKKLSELWSQFEVVQSKIEAMENANPTIVDKNALLEQQIQQRASFETPYFTVMSRFESILEQINIAEARTTPITQVNRADGHRETNVRLPKIDLPVFTGSYEDWYSYQDVFEKLIHNNESLADIERFHYLRSSLKDKPAEVIKAIETTTDNYHEAWEAIKERFDNKRWIVQKHIRAIFDAPIVTKENHVALRKLLDTILKHLHALRALKRPTEMWDDLLIHIIVSKLDGATNKAWEISLVDASIPDLKALMEFLSRRCWALETASSRSHNSPSNNAVQKQSSKYKYALVASVTTTNVSCSVCKDNHQLYHCKKFANLPIEERIKVVKKAHLCMNCLRSASHQAKACNSGACRKCAKKHNTLLHIAKSDDSQSDKDSISKTNAVKEVNAPLPVSTQCVASHLSSSILLSTAVVHVYDAKRQAHACRVLLDSGSQMNFVTQEFASRLQLEERSLEVSVTRVMGGIVRATRVVSVCIKSRFNNFQETIECVILPKITQRLLQQCVSIQSVTIPTGIKLADPNVHTPADIDILVGAEIFWKILCAGQIKQAKNQPIVQKTHFGWIISGCTPGAAPNAVLAGNCHLAVSDDLCRMLSKFWEVEHNLTTPQYSEEEKACERMFAETVKQNEEGRYIVKLSVKQDISKNLGESREIAAKRFKALEKRLVSQQHLYEEYKRFMEEYQALGHMREVNEDSMDIASHPHFYLPHHAVKNETSTTTKLRVVFDGSCKSTTGVSLNDALKVGPTVQDDLISILVRFRTFKIALTADVTKMYRQVLVEPNQTSLQRIVWRNAVDQPLKTFELLTVTYGTSSASFLAIKVLRRIAEDYSVQYPLASRVALRDFYVDDLVSGADTVLEASQIKDKMIHLLGRGKFEFRKWASNEASLRDKQPDTCKREFTLASDKNTEMRALGIEWDCATDSFKFSSINDFQPLERLTKRSILSRIALIFDPLGLLGPVTVLAKMVMQDLWRLKMDWDESIPLDCYTKWKQYESELKVIQTLSIPRLTIEAGSHSRLELHGFSDASKNAYGACIYLRSTAATGKHTVSLLCSKSRVAPLKSLSLPRLELCAAWLLAQLVHKVSRCLLCNIDVTWLWTDSTIVLSWLQSCNRSWTPFVANRVGEIQQLTPITCWRRERCTWTRFKWTRC